MIVYELILKDKDRLNSTTFSFAVHGELAELNQIPNGATVNLKVAMELVKKSDNFVTERNQFVAGAIKHKN